MDYHGCIINSSVITSRQHIHPEEATSHTHEISVEYHSIGLCSSDNSLEVDLFRLATIVNGTPIGDVINFRSKKCQRYFVNFQCQKEMEVRDGAF